MHSVLCSISWATFPVPSSVSVLVCSPGVRFRLPDALVLPSDLLALLVRRRFPFSSPPSHPPLLSSFPQWDCLRLPLVCSCLRALPGSLPLLRSRGSSSGSRLPALPPAGLTSLPCLASRRPCPLPPRSPERFARSLNARRAAGLGCPPARHCAVEFGGISADVTSLPTLRPS